MDTIQQIVAAALSLSKQVIVVDGHSSDATVQKAREAGAQVIFDGKLGKGEAIRCAIPHLQTPVTVFMDADGSHDPADIPKLSEPILAGVADHVTGSRMLGGSDELHGGFDEFLRLTGNAFIITCINKRFKTRLSDSQNGFRAVATDVLKRLDLRENITTIEQEMIIRTLKQGFRMAEVPAHENRRKFNQSSIVLGRVWFQYLWSFLWNLYFRR